jgi:hypothetical protein
MVVTSASERSRVVRWLVRALIVLAAILGPLTVRACIEGRAELREADGADTTEQAIVHLGRAARWRLPIADHDEQARARLEAIADTAERDDDDELALVAWRELRAALLGTRTGSVVDTEQLERANSGIVRGMVAMADEAGEPEASERWQAELDAPPASDGVGTRVSAVCFVLWWVTLIGFVMQGIGDGLRRSALVWGVANLVLLLGWLLMM